MELDKFLEQEGQRAINPDMPKELIKDISKCASLRRWKEEAIRGFRVRQNLAFLRQRLIGMATRRLEWQRKAGMRVVARLDEDFFWQHRLQYGPGCWHDKEFREDTLKRHPEMAVPETRRSVSVITGGLRVSENSLGLDPVPKEEFPVRGCESDGSGSRSISGESHPAAAAGKP